MKLGSAAAALLLGLSAPSGLAQSERDAPLDFSYRVQGDGRIAPLVFSDGADIYIQPDRSQLAELRVLDAPFVQEGPYVVVRGLHSRITLAWKGAMTTVSYAPASQPAAQPPPTTAPESVKTPPCNPSLELAETSYPVAFPARSSRLTAAFLEQLPAIVADAKTADVVTVVGRPDVSNAELAERRARKVRAALVAQGVPEALIHLETRSRPEHGSELTISRRQETKCPTDAARSETNTRSGTNPTRSGTNQASPEATGRTGAAFDGKGVSNHSPAAAAGLELAAAALAAKADQPAAMSLDSALAAALAGDSELGQPVSDEDRRRAIQQVISLVQAGKITQSMGARLMLAANSAQPTGAAMPQALMTGAVRASDAQATTAVRSATLTFLPNSSVRRVLHAYLRERGIDLDWQVQGDLIVEEFAQIAGQEPKDVIETALRRLGLKGTLVAGRLLIVESRS